MNITVYDPWANPESVKREYGIMVLNTLPEVKYDAIVLAVAHQKFREIKVDALKADKSILFDVKGILNKNTVDGRL